MNLNLKRKVWYMCTAVFVVCVTSIVYSCNSEDAFFDETGNCSGKVHTRALSAKSISTLVDSVAESDEFIDFVMETEALAKKTKAYTKTLSDEKFEELMYNQNNDDYMEDFMKKAGIEEDLKRIAKVKTKLVMNEQFARLTEEERMQLFLGEAKLNTRVMLKQRPELTEFDCDARRQADYSWARATADLGLIGCTCMVEIPLAACVCYTMVMANYANDIRLADRAYEDCMRSIGK